MRLAEGDSERSAEFVFHEGRNFSVYVMCEKFSRGKFSFECGHGIEVLIGQRSQRFFEDFMGEAHVDHDADAVEGLAEKFGIDHVGSAVHLLRRAKGRIWKRMSNHDVIANFDTKHEEEVVEWVNC